MFKRILVTLDGSDLSERALEPVFRIAEQFLAEVVLLRVLAPEPIAMSAGSGPQYLELNGIGAKSDWTEADTYLRGIRAEWKNTGVQIETRVAMGAPPEMILKVAEGAGADLIAMSTHGRSGLDRFLYGSVAEAVLRGTPVPLLLIPVK
jgi:nucleotide-binding universal stress UspA family protein